jgi:hypothetical protein
VVLRQTGAGSKFHETQKSESNLRGGTCSTSSVWASAIRYYGKLDSVRGITDSVKNSETWDGTG